MGVLACDRKGCSNIMCDLLVNNNYLCSECRDEFVNLYPSRIFSSYEMSEKFAKFIRSPKEEKSDEAGINAEEWLRAAWDVR